MLNLRPIDNKFYLSGGWVDVPKDASWLEFHHFRAVLDLQFTPFDFSLKSSNTVRDMLDEQGIKYLAVPMSDDENNDLDSLFEITNNQLSQWDELYKESRDKILVKCGVGISRSVSVLISYYCQRDRLTYTEAKARIASHDQYNYGGLPIGIELNIDQYLRIRYPDVTLFGERI